MACKDACTVKPGFEPVPPQLYFEFETFSGLGSAEKKRQNLKKNCGGTVLNPGFTVQASLPVHQVFF